MTTASNSRAVLGRLGFLLVAAGCAIGLGNVWRFPYTTGTHGGMVFVLLYIFFLCAVLPVMIMEFAVGRASRRNMGLALRELEPAGTRWSRFGWLSLVGSYILMMFYTTVTGWMLIYCWELASGSLAGLDPGQVGAAFGGLLASPGLQITGMTITVLLGFGICALGVQEGVERVVKLMMAGLFLLLALLVYALTKNFNVAVIVAAVCIVPLCIVYMVKASLFSGLFPALMSYLAVFDRFYTFVYGIFDVTAVIYYISVIVFALFLTVQVMEKKRWS